MTVGEEALVLGLVPAACWEQIVQGVVTIECIKAVMSKVLGYGILAGAIIIKVPQILKITANASVLGLSSASTWMEVLGHSITLAYSWNKGFPFSTYGESWFMLVQLWIIVALFHRYGGSPASSMAWAPFLAKLVVYLGVMGVALSASGDTAASVLAFLQSLTIPNVVMARVPQIWTNFSNGHSGQLSGATCFMQFAGASVRVFTTVQELGMDWAFLGGFLVAAVLNGIIFFQVLLLPSPPAAKSASRKSGKSKKID